MIIHVNLYIENLWNNYISQQCIQLYKVKRQYINQLLLPFSFARQYRPLLKLSMFHFFIVIYTFQIIIVHNNKYISTNVSDLKISFISRNVVGCGVGPHIWATNRQFSESASAYYSQSSIDTIIGEWHSHRHHQPNNIIQPRRIKSATFARRVNVSTHKNSTALLCKAKKGSICLLVKWIDTAFWLCTAQHNNAVRSPVQGLANACDVWPATIISDVQHVSFVCYGGNH